MRRRRGQEPSKATGHTWPPGPPQNEADEVRIVRLAEEEKAKKVSDSIDRTIGAEKERRKKTCEAKVLLLGRCFVRCLPCPSSPELITSAPP